MRYNNPYDYIRQRILLPIFSTLPLFCQLTAQAAGIYWANNVAILDMRIRTVSATVYTREIVIRDFDGTIELVAGFGFGPDFFADDGQGNDLVAGDGVFSSERCYPHNPAMPFVALNAVTSALETIILDTQFQHTEQLEN